MSPRKDLVGLITESGLEVLEYIGNNKFKKALYNCRCTCGKIFTAVGSAILSGSVKSCGCYSRERLGKSRILDLTNKRFGKLVAVKLTDMRKSGERVWECKCDCGNITYVTTGNLRSGNTTSCGCSILTKDLTGQRFGRLVAIRRVTETGDKRPMWLCRCDCGNECTIGRYDLESGNTKSCGCLSKELSKLINRTHGICSQNSRIYNIWRKIVDRCYNFNNHKYRNYGGRGIKVCDEWLIKENSQGLINFYNWSLANGYRDDLTIDRIDVNGNYEPSNCRWISLTSQTWNKTTTIRTADGYSIIQFIREYGLDYKEVMKNNPDIQKITIQELYDRYFYEIEETWY